uniref:Uncharacterized protein n=1 Tax=Rhizophora mucronata TaxID=61149 RepID=A0A2P2R3T1_RHIMU
MLHAKIHSSHDVYNIVGFQG